MYKAVLAAALCPKACSIWLATNEHTQTTPITTTSDRVTVSLRARSRPCHQPRMGDRIGKASRGRLFAAMTSTLSLFWSLDTLKGRPWLSDQSELKVLALRPIERGPSQRPPLPVQRAAAKLRAKGDLGAPPLRARRAAGRGALIRQTDGQIDRPAGPQRWPERPIAGRLDAKIARRSSPGAPGLRGRRARRPVAAAAPRGANDVPPHRCRGKARLAPAIATRASGLRRWARAKGRQARSCRAGAARPAAWPIDPVARRPRRPGAVDHRRARRPAP